MKKIFLIGLLLSIFVTVNAQTDYSELARQQAELGNYEEAIRLESENLKLIEQSRGKNNEDYISSLMIIVLYNAYLDNYKEAIQLGTEASKIIADTQGKDNVEYTASLYYLAWLNSKLGYYQEAIELGTEALNILEKVSEKNPYYAANLNNLAYYHSYLGNCQEAIRLGTEALNIFEEFMGKNHPEYATYLDNLADYYSDFEIHQEALRLETEALNIREKVLGKGHPDYVNSLSKLASFYGNLGNYQEAIRLGTEALNIRKKVLGKRHVDYTISLSKLASFYGNLGNYQEAIKLGSEALNIVEEVMGKNHPDYANTLSNLAAINSDLGNYQEAIKLGTEALNIFEELVGKNHPDYAHILSNLAYYYAESRNYQEALRLGTEALEIQEGILGKSHDDYVITLHNLANCYDNLGNYQEAILLGTKAKTTFEETKGKNNLSYATALSNLSTPYYHLGNYQEALRLETEALNIREKFLGKGHPDYAKSLSNLACYHADIGSYQEAISLGTEALNIFEELLGKNHPHYATCLGNLAIYHVKIGNYQDAIRLGTEALNISEEVLGKNHPYYATSLNNLAGLNSYLGNYQDAIRLDIEALNIVEEVMGKNHPYYSATLGNLAIDYYLNNDNIENLEKIARESFSLDKDLLLRSFSFLLLSERDAYWNANHYVYIKWFPEFAYSYPDANFIDLGYNAALLSKGILLNSEIEFDRFMAENGTPELADKYNEVKRIRIQLNKLYEMPIADRWCDTDSLERVANILEREVMYESKEFGDYTRNLSVTWQDVQKGLKDKDVAIEFVSFKLNEDSTMYMAYVLKPGMETPELVKLFEEKDLKSKRIYSSTDPEKIYDQKEATELIWRKFEPYLEGCENVYFAPDGLLHQIAIEYLPALDGEGMISDRYNIFRLSSTRQLAIEHGDRKIEKAVLYGGIEFDSTVAKMEEENRHYENELMAQNSVHRGYFGDNLVEDFNLRDCVSYLPGTATEVEEIQKIFNKKHKKTELYTGDKASEASFKSLSGKPNQILHLATHGFYWNENEADRMALNNDRLMFMSSFGENGPRYVEDKALTRSGLLMAGANNILRRDSVPDNIDDGILTAREISMLNLRDVDLVVLSACQTGLGDIVSDGVFGLQRGFKKAGANSLLMSLWKVDDDATRILMTEFYKNYLSGKSKRESLLAAQRVLQNDPKYYQPQYWAAFILLDGLN